MYAKYEDHTLPYPYSIQDDLDIQVESKLESEIPPIQRISVEDVFFANSLGIPIEPIINEQIQVVGIIHNNQFQNKIKMIL